MKTDPAPTFEGRSYWRSLERLAASPALRQVACEHGEEFPPGAAEPPDAITRRRLMALMGASFSLAGLASCRRPVEKIVPYVNAPEDFLPGVPDRYATTMPLGTSAYGAVVESHEGRPTKVEGNELHPSSSGAANPWMQASVLGLYDPDRSRRPQRREAIDEPWQTSTWEEFLDVAKQVLSEGRSSDGGGLAVLTGATSSPTLARLATSFRERFPAARWVVHEAAGDGNVYRGLELLTGEPLRPLYDVARARTVVAFDADILLTESEALSHSRGFAAGRRLDGGARGAMNRLYAIESTLTLTGAAADHRLRLQSRSIGAAVAALGLELAARGLPLNLPAAAAHDLDPEILGKLRLIAGDLAANRSASLVAAGRGQPPGVHALVFAINQALGAVGETVSFRRLQDVGWSRPGELAVLAEDLRRGAVRTLVVLGANPAYDAPADLDFADALRQVPLSIHLGSHLDETAALCHWHLPEAHYLEAWGDARAADGTPSVIQPLIAPLHDGKSAIEVLDMITRGQSLAGVALVRKTWLDSILGSSGFDERWKRVLHDGVFVYRPPELVESGDSEGSEGDAADEEPDAGDPEDELPGRYLPAVVPETRPEALGEAWATIGESRSTAGLEVVFRLSPAVHDGRFANNGWLEELPDPITKLTWDNAALVSPKTAAELGLETGDLATLRCRGRTAEAPILVLPGQVDGSVALTLGYGRRAAGRMAEGTGFDAYVLRTSGAPDFDGSLEITRTGRRYAFALTQNHHAMEGRDLVRETTLAEYRDGAVPGIKNAPPPRLWQAHEEREDLPGTVPQWGMTVDLNACTGCNACVVACQSENNVPIVGKEQVMRSREMHWLRIDRYFEGDLSEPAVAFQPVPCMHCENAPCEQVCPVAATVHDRNGLNVMVYNRCIGTRYCSNNCPYKVRRFNFFNFTHELPELVQLAMNPDVTVRSRGVMEKCTYCIQRIREGERAAKLAERPLADGDVVTACQQTCPAQAIVFGDVSDPGSRVSTLKSGDRNYVLLGELGNLPRTSYLAKVRNPHPRWDEP